MVAKVGSRKLESQGVEYQYIFISQMDVLLLDID